MKYLPRYPLFVILPWLAMLSLSQGQEPHVLEGAAWTATVDAGELTGIEKAGQQLLGVGGTFAGPGVMLDEKVLRAEAGDVTMGSDGLAAASSFGGVEGLEVLTRFEWDEASDELVVRQEANSPQPGLAAVEWTLGPIPYDSKILVPAGGGTQVDANTPDLVLSFNYPLGWEAQLVVVQTSDDAGFYVWSDDETHCFKRLQLERTDEGWMMHMMVFNYAPFAELTSASTPNWRVGVYEGDWRVPALKYRQWRNSFMKPLPFAEQTPSWVADTRVQVLTNQNIECVEALAKKVDPSQVVLFLLQWRKPEFDRDYPNYDEFGNGYLDLIKRAHELGFRVMLYVNHFSVSDTHPSYKDKYYDLIVRNPFGKHEKLTFTNIRVKPAIVNYYVNPASRLWREDFIERMKRLVEVSGADALHLDQNFHVHNDYNGLIDGMTYVEGVQALHRELREALPEVALGGENVNELTFSYMSFAQRTVWSAMRGTIDRSSIGNGHPISSFLFRPYVKFVAWPGSPSAYEMPQVYSAWWEDYRGWGVLPSFKLLRQTPDDMEEPQGFFRQQFDEARFWTENRVDQNVDGPWPDDVAFPFMTQDGRPVYRMKDRSTLCGKEEISRTLSDISSTDLPGQIDGWLFYNADVIYGLDPARWYPYFTEPRDLSAFHFESLPDGLLPLSTVSSPDTLLVRLGYDQTRLLMDLGEVSETLTGGLKDHNGMETVLELPITGRGNASLFVGDGVLRLTPPSTAPMDTDGEGDLVNQSIGTGEIFARYSLKLPSVSTAFFSEVGIDGRAENKSDGMDFTVVASNGETSISETVFNAMGARKPLNLDLSEFAGQDVTLTLLGGPGPNNQATKDQGLWYHPRIVVTEPDGDSVPLAFVPGDSEWKWLVADSQLMAISDLPQEGKTRLLPDCPSISTLLYLAREPFAATVPGSLEKAGAAFTVMDAFGYVKGERGGMTLEQLGRALVPAKSVGRADIPVQVEAGISPVVIEVDLSLISASPGLVVRVEVDGQPLALETRKFGAGRFSYRSEPVELGGVHLLSVVLDAAKWRGDVSLSQLDVSLLEE